MVRKQPSLFKVEKLRVVLGCGVCLNVRSYLLRVLQNSSYCMMVMMALLIWLICNNSKPFTHTNIITYPDTFGLDQH